MLIALAAFCFVQRGIDAAQRDADSTRLVAFCTGWRSWARRSILPHMADTQPALDLAPIPAPDRVLHARAAEHELDAAYMRAVDVDDWRDAVKAWPVNPQQLPLDFGEGE